MYLLFSGLRGSYQRAQPTHGLEDNVPDVHDEDDFDIPNTQAVLERFMTHMSKLADVEYRVQGPGELQCKDLVSCSCCHMLSLLREPPIRWLLLCQSPRKEICAQQVFLLQPNILVLVNYI
jgi:hypothetical protein